MEIKTRTARSVESRRISGLAQQTRRSSPSRGEALRQELSLRLKAADMSTGRDPYEPCADHAQRWQLEAQTPLELGGGGGGQRDWYCRVEAWDEDEDEDKERRVPRPRHPLCSALKSVRTFSQELSSDKLPCWAEIRTQRKCVRYSNSQKWTRNHGCRDGQNTGRGRAGEGGQGGGAERGEENKDENRALLRGPSTTETSPWKRA